MAIIFFILLSSLIMWIGLVIQLMIKESDYLQEISALSFPIGLGIVINSIIMLSPFFDLKESFVLIVVICLCSSFIIRRRIAKYFILLSRFLKNFIKKRVHLGLLNSTLLLFLILIVSGEIFINIVWPISDWDALTSYDFFARVFYLADSINPINKGFTILDPGLGRPPFTSIMHTLVYWIFGEGQLGKIYYSFLLISLCWILYVNFKEKFPFWLAIIFTIFVISTPLINLSLVAYTNFPFAVYLLIALIYLQKWLNNNQIHFLVIALLCLFTSLWVRQDFFAFHFLTALVIAIIAFKDKKLLLISLLVFLVSFGGIKIWGLVSTYQLSLLNSESYLQFVAEKGPIIKHTPPSLLETVVNIKLHSLSQFWEVMPFIIRIFINDLLIYATLFCITLILSGRKIIHDYLFLTLWIVAAVVAFFAGTYIFSMTFYEDWFGIAGSASRMISFLPPLIVYYFCIMIDKQLIYDGLSKLRKQINIKLK